MQRDLKAGIESDLPCVVRWLDELYPASKTTCRTEKLFDIGGAEEIVNYQVVIRMDALSSYGGQPFSAATQPIKGNDITVDGLTFKIVSIDDGQGAFLTLGLHDPNASK